MADVTIEADRFGATLEQILGEIADKVDEGSGRAVRKSAQKGMREAKAGSPERTGEYAAGWSYRARKTPEGWSAEVGNSDKPGLVHLLEKGHARVGGGRVAPSPPGGHVAPAADAAFDELWEQVVKEVEAL